MRRFFPGATSFKNSSSVRVENALLALSTTSCQELIATCTDNSWDVIGTSLSLDSRPSFMQPSVSCHLFGAESLVGFQVGIGDAQRTSAFIYPRSILHFTGKGTFWSVPSGGMRVMAFGTRY